MQTRIGFLTGIAVGYVFGARAGRTRYEQIKKQADALWRDPRVQEKVTTATETVKAKAPEVQARLTEKAPVVGQKLADSASSAASVVGAKAADVKEKVAGTASDAKQAAADTASDLKDSAKDAVRSSDDKGRDSNYTGTHTRGYTDTSSQHDHTGNQIGVEPTSDVEPHTIRFESAEGDR